MIKILITILAIVSFQLPCLAKSRNRFSYDISITIPRITTHNQERKIKPEKQLDEDNSESKEAKNQNQKTIVYRTIVFEN